MTKAGEIPYARLGRYSESIAMTDLESGSERRQKKSVEENVRNKLLDVMEDLRKSKSQQAERSESQSWLVLEMIKAD
jgi:hypothetical protein